MTIVVCFFFRGSSRHGIGGRVVVKLLGGPSERETSALWYTGWATSWLAFAKGCHQVRYSKPCLVCVLLEVGFASPAWAAGLKDSNACGANTINAHEAVEQNALAIDVTCSLPAYNTRVSSASRANVVETVKHTIEKEARCQDRQLLLRRGQGWR